MRIIDLHCYPGTQVWIDSQGPYVEALAKYWNRGWVGKTEEAVVQEFTEAGVEACLVALDLETTVATPPCTNDYVHDMWKRHPKRIIQCWGTLDPFKGELAIREAQHAVRDLGFIGFHFHPIMQHFAVNDQRFYPLFETINELKAAVMIDVGTTGTAIAPCSGEVPAPAADRRRTHTPPFSTFTSWARVGRTAGIDRAAPVRMSNFAPCLGQAILWSRSSPSASGPPSCVQTSSMA